MDLLFFFGILYVVATSNMVSCHDGEYSGHGDDDVWELDPFE